MSERTKVDRAEVSRERSPEDYMRDDPLIAWLNRQREEVDHLLRSTLSITAKRDLRQRLLHLENCLESLQGFAAELSVMPVTHTTLSTSRSAVDAFTDILHLRENQIDSTSDHPAWIDAVKTRGGNMAGQLNWQSEVSTLGCLNDIFIRAAATEESLASSRSLSPPEDIVRQDFGRQFIGTGADDLRAHINLQRQNTENNKSFYSNVVPVLQSSGAGKTRTVVQLSQKELGLLICVRSQPSNPETVVSEPPRDQETARWLQGQSGKSGGSSIFEQNRTLAVWLIAMAEVIGTFYRDQWTQSIKRNHGETWPLFVERVGQLLAPSTAIISSAWTSAQSMEVDGQSIASRADLLSAINRRAQEMTAQFPVEAYQAKQGSRTANDGQEESRCVHFFEESLKVAFSAVSSFVATHGGDEAFFHFAIDECGQLGRRLSRFRRIWQVLPSNCWMLWMDTNTDIPLTYGSITGASSARLASQELTLMRPFVALPQDIELMHNFVEFREIVLGNRKVTFASTLNWLPRMGRPLLSDSHVMQSAEVVESNSVIVLTNLAKKICLTLQPFEDCRATIALIAQRFPITLVGLSGNLDAQLKGPIPGQIEACQAFAEKLVESHMRRLVSVSETGDVIRTSGPSEPLLSLASAHAFSDNPRQAWSAAIRHIKKARAEYGLEVGEAGEEIVRLLVSAAMDLCWADRADGERSTFLRLLRLVNLKDFLRKLFIKGKDEPEEFRPVLTWAAEYWLNFTHVIVSAENFHADAPLKRAGLSEAWLRQGAILGPKNQAGWDLLLPIYKSAAMPLLNDTFEHDNLSFIPIQTKNVAKGEKAGWNTDFSASSVKLEKNASGAPCTIWFDLRRKFPMVQVNKQALRRSQRLASFNHQASSKTPPYHILARGHSSSAIKMLSEIADADAELPDLLGADISDDDDDDDSFLDERTRLLNQGKMTWIQNRSETLDDEEATDVCMESKLP